MEGAEGGHLGLSAGMGAGAHMRLLCGNRRGDCTYSYNAISPSHKCLLTLSLQPATSPALLPMSMMAVRVESLSFLSPVQRFLLLSHPHNLAFKSLAPMATALPFTFIRWRHSKRAVMASLVSQGRGLDPVWCQ